MSTTTCGCTAVRPGRLEWPGLGPLHWPYLDFSLAEVVLAAEPAVCLTEDGVFWEYDGCRFLSTDADAGTWRTLAEALEDIPSGPWRHVPPCTCEVCRLGNV
jgi:hypothetical protein